MDSDLPSDRLSAAELLLVPDKVLLPEGPIEGHAVVVANGVFIDVGPHAAVMERHPELVPILLSGKLVMPGFVDTHHHLTRMFAKALAFGEPSQIFKRIWIPLEGTLDDELAYLTAKAAALESLRGGFTTVVDAGTRASGATAVLARATQEAGLRCVLGLICNDLGGDGRHLDRDAILAGATAHLDQWRSQPLVHPSLAISLPEAATDEMLRDISAMAKRAGAIFQTHINEHLAAVEASLVRHRLRPIEHLFHMGTLGPHVLAAHSTLVTPSELMILQETDTAVAYNPVASQWKGNAVAPAEMMHALGIRFGLGTDGTRSDGFRLMDAAEATQRTAFGIGVGDFSCGAGWMWLDHATMGGANAAGIGHVTGEIASGKAADFLIVDIDVPEMNPSWDLGWELVRLGDRDQIIAVFVDGKMRLWKGWPVDWDGHALVRYVAKRVRAATASAPIQRIHPSSTSHRAAVAAAGHWRP